MIDAFITGAPHSGATLVAEAFRRMGAWFGTAVDPARLENVDVTAATWHRVVGVGANKAVCDPRYYGRVDGAGVLAVEFWSAVKDIFNAEVQTGSPVVYKHPGALALWSTWVEACPRARWVVCRRSPYELPRAMARAWGATPERWVPLVTACEDSLAALHRSGAEVYEVEVDALVQGDYRAIGAAARGIGARYAARDVALTVEPSRWR